MRSGSDKLNIGTDNGIISLWENDMYDNIKLIVCDVDKTLAMDGVNLTERTIRDINELHKQGYLFCVNSGRAFYQAENVIKRWNLDFQPELVIAMNGAIVHDYMTGKEYHFTELQPDVLKEIVDMMSPLKDLYTMNMYFDGYMVYQRDDELLEVARKKYYNEKIIAAEDDSVFYSEANPKIMFRLYDVNRMPEVEAHVDKHPSDKYIGFKTQPHIFEFTDPRTSKGAALKQYCEITGFPIEDVATFGDTSNDIDIIKYSGLGVAMLNGSDDVKEAADVVTRLSCEDEGFADFVETYFLK